jgi:flap endonuclease-1
MGIRGLTGWIAWATPTSIQLPTWEDFAGARIGVDVLGLLYKSKAQSRDPIVYLATFLAACKKYSITPVPVFDGKPPESKRKTIKSRTVTTTARPTIYLTSDERDTAKQLCYACGVSPLNASGEADNVLAYFMKTGYVKAIISNDMDLLARGVETLIVPEGYTLPGDPAGWKQYTLSHILNTVQLSYGQFVEMCILMGSDYTSGEQSIPYKIAYWSIKYRGIFATLQWMGVKDIVPYAKAYGILVGLSESPAQLMGDKQWDKLKSGAAVECEALEKFRETHLSSISDNDYEALLL